METNVNNKCRSFTSLEQSKVLAKILPLESADMHYATWTILDGEFIVSQNQGSTIKDLQEDYGNQIIPCWSLAALLNVLPNSENISTNLSKGGYIISTIEYTNSWFVDYEDETNGLNNYVTSADNPVDACVEMIIHLNKFKKL